MRFSHPCVVGVSLLTIALASTSAKAQDSVPAVSGLQLAVAIEQSLEAAIAKAEKSVVAIACVKRGEVRESNIFQDQQLAPFGQNNQEREPTSTEFVPSEYATGVVIDRGGLILTNYHVLKDPTACDYYVTTIERKIYKAEVKAADPRSDLAILTIQSRDLTPVTFGNGGALKKGQIVIALGNPYAIARDGQASASWGIVANLQRKAGRTPEESSAGSSYPTGKSTLHHLGTLIQTDAKLNLGTSGGALLNLQGEMVGLTTSLAATAGYEQAAGYAIPVDETFRRVVDEMKQGRAPSFGFLGVAPEDLLIGERLNGKQGVRIHDVKWGTPAQKSGLQANDVITHVNGQPVFDNDSLVLKVGSLPADSQVKLSVERDGRRVPVVATLAKYRVLGKQIATYRDPAWRGLRVDHWSTMVDFRLGPAASIDTDGCVVITEVEPTSPADRQSLKPDMVITHVDGKRIASPKDFLAAVGGKQAAVKLRISEPLDGGPTERVIAAE